MMNGAQWFVFCNWLAKQDVRKSICRNCGLCKVYDGTKEIKIKRMEMTEGQAKEIVNSLPKLSDQKVASTNAITNPDRYNINPNRYKIWR